MGIELRQAFAHQTAPSPGLLPSEFVEAAVQVETQRKGSHGMIQQVDACLNGYFQCLELIDSAGESAHQVVGHPRAPPGSGSRFRIDSLQDTGQL